MIRSDPSSKAPRIRHEHSAIIYTKADFLRLLRKAAAKPDTLTSKNVEVDGLLLSEVPLPPATTAESAENADLGIIREQPRGKGAAASRGGFGGGNQKYGNQQGFQKGRGHHNIPASSGPIEKQQAVQDPTAQLKGNFFSKYAQSDQEHSDDWYYLDDQDIERGPNPSESMDEWHAGGYFKDTLKIKNGKDGAYYTLKELMVTFSKRPIQPDHTNPAKFEEKKIARLQEK